MYELHGAVCNLDMTTVDFHLACIHEGGQMHYNIFYCWMKNYGKKRSSALHYWELVYVPSNPCMQNDPHRKTCALEKGKNTAKHRTNF